MAPGRRRDILENIVGQDLIERLLLLIVFEVLVDALLFQQPADKIEVCFPVLHAIDPAAVTAGEVRFDIGETLIVTHLLDDVGNGHFLEDAAVRSAGQKPEPGAYYGAVTVVLAPRTLLAEAADKAIEMTRLVIGQAQVDADILAGVWFPSWTLLAISDITRCENSA